MYYFVWVREDGLCCALFVKCFLSQRGVRCKIRQWKVYILCERKIHFNKGKALLAVKMATVQVYSNFLLMYENLWYFWFDCICIAQIKHFGCIVLKRYFFKRGKLVPVSQKMFFIQEKKSHVQISGWHSYWVHPEWKPIWWGAQPLPTWASLQISLRVGRKYLFSRSFQHRTGGGVRLRALLQQEGPLRDPQQYS